MPESTTQVTAAEISRLAGVTRATVSNWRRRHPDFPAPTGGTDTSPTYDLDTVRGWLSQRGSLPRTTPEAGLRNALRSAAEGAGPLARTLLAIVPSLARLGSDELTTLAALPEDSPADELSAVIREVHGDARGLSLSSVRALVRCLDTRGAEATLNVLAEQLPDDKTAGAYTTPRPLADLMVALPRSVEWTLDPACGTGGLLAAAVRRGATCALGQELSADHVALAEVRIEVAAREWEISAGDSLRADAFGDEQVDAVMCNPPFGVRDWGHDDLSYDERWRYGLPPRSESELAWVQHCLAHLDNDGLAVVLMPPGAAERPGGRRVRAELVRTGALRAVIALPQGAAPPLHVSLQLWALAPPLDADPPPVLFVDATGLTGPDRKRDIDWTSMSERVLTTWREFQDDPKGFVVEPGVTRARPVADLLDDTVDLTPQRNVRGGGVLEPQGLDAQVHESQELLRRTRDTLVSLGTGELWQTAGAEPVSWRTATVADLLRGGAVTLHRTAPARASGTVVEQAVAEDDTSRPVLTHHDVRRGKPPSGSLRDLPLGAAIPPIRVGDVILPEMVNHTGSVRARVATRADAGSVLGTRLLMLRPDPERLESWFLAGFLSTGENIQGATVGSSIYRLDVKRLQVPLLPLDRQRDYGRAFHRVHLIRSAADLATRVGNELADAWALGLTSGALLPPDDDS